MDVNSVFSLLQTLVLKKMKFAEFSCCMLLSGACMLIGGWLGYTPALYSSLAPRPSSYFSFGGPGTRSFGT